jgi:hypothetical protein
MGNRENLGELYTSNNELNANSAISIGNTVANLNANSTIVQIANSSSQANLQPTKLAIGANVLVDTTHIVIGNSTINLSTNSTIITISNVTDTTNVTPSGLVVGSSTINSTIIAAGANALLSITDVRIGNLSAYGYLSATQARVTNSSSEASITPIEMRIGDSGANVILNSTGINVVNATNAGVLTQTTLQLGNTSSNAGVVNTIAVKIGNSSVNAVLSTTQLLFNGVLAMSGAPFPATTRIAFQQTAAPTGWTKDVTNNDKALRVVNGTVGTGGTVPFSTVFGKTGTDATTLSEAQIPSHTHTGPSHTHTGPSHTHTVPNHTHTGPSHTHTVPNHTHNEGTLLVGTGITNGTGVFRGTSYNNMGDSQGTTVHAITTGAALSTIYLTDGKVYGVTGGWSGLTDAQGTGATGGWTGLTDAQGTGATGASGTGATGGTGGGTSHIHPMDIRVQYVDIIIASKD